MTAADWILLLGALLFGATTLVMAFVFARAPYVTDEQAAAWGPTPPAALTFDQHAATAAALLRPDDPNLPDLPTFSFAEQVELYVALHAPKES